MIVGALNSDSNGYDSGSSYVIFGKVSGFSATMALSSLNGSNGFRLVGMESSRSGVSVSSAGDINGDGFDDVIVRGSSGYSYVVFGKASGFDSTFNLSGLNGSNGFRLYGETAHVNFNYSASTAGDVNGDGFDDVIVGAEGADPFVGKSGSSYVVFGKTSGFSATINLSDLNGNNGFRLDGVGNNNNGHSVSDAGDVNGDGFDDLIVSDRWSSPNGNFSGSSYVVFGRDSGFDAAMSLSELNGSNGFRLDGAKVADFSGGSISSAGDINGDGFDDVIVGAHGADSNGDSSGSSYIVFGKASGFEATMNLSELNGSNGFRLDGAKAGDASGGSVSNAGDVNGDGFGDLIVGAGGADPNGNQSGSSYVVFGKASGFDATMDLSSFHGKTALRLDGAAGDYSGYSVSSAGDVNGDGFDDVMIGAVGADPNGSRSGASYVIFGSSNFIGIVSYLGTPGDDNLSGTSAAERFDADAGNDTLTGGGGADVFFGDESDDVMGAPDLSFESMDGGTGNDTLALTGGDINLNLASLHDKISNIEAINLTGNGDNLLTVAPIDVLNLSDTSDTLIVTGNAGDRLVLNNDWADGGIQGDFHTYLRHGAVLMVDVAVHSAVAPGVVSLANLNGNNGFRLDGVSTYDRFGFSVSSAGDVNGDGFDDVIVGAPFVGTLSGVAYIVFGKASGFESVMNVSTFNGNNGFAFGSSDYDAALGWAVSNAGDVNGDGFDDVIVNAPGVNRSDGYITTPGASYVVFGKASGFESDIGTPISMVLTVSV